MNLKHWLLSITLITLAACGSGGGGSSSSDNPTQDDPTTDDPDPVDPTPDDPDPVTPTQPPVERISLSGLAIKGLAQGAAINVYPINEAQDGFSDEAIGTGTSNQQGQYQIQLNEDSSGYTGVVKIVLSYQEGAMLECDNLAAEDEANACGTGNALGEFYPMPDDFELSSIAELGSGSETASGANIVNITALTTLSASFIQNGDPAGNGLIDAEAVNRGNNQIRAVLGLPSRIDLTSSRPENVNNPEQEGDEFYGAINASFQALASETDTPLAEVIENFATEFEDGQIIAKTDTSGATETTLENLLNNANALDTGTDLTKLSNIIAATPTGQETTVTPPAISLGGNLKVDTNQEITLTATTVDGEPATYDWFYSSTPDAFLQQGASNTYTFTTPAVASTLTIQVIAKNAAGLADTDIITIDVVEANAAASSVVGDYYLSSMHTGFARHSADSSFWFDINIENGLTVDATISELAGEAVVTVAGGDSAYKSFWTEISSPGFLPLTAEAEINPEDEQSFPITPLASGAMTIHIPDNVDIDIEDGNAEANQAFDLNFIQLAEGLYWGRGIEFDKEYSLNADNTPDFSNQLEESGMITTIMLAEKNDVNSLTALNGKTYVGFEHAAYIDVDSEFSTAVKQQVLTFTDGNGTFTLESDSASLEGAPNKANSVDSGQNAYDLLPPSALTNDPEVTPLPIPTNGLIAPGQELTTNAGTERELYLSADNKAIIGHYSYWENDTTNDYNDPSPFFRESVKVAMLEAPAAPVDMNGKTFAFHLVVHWAGIPEAPSPGSDTAGQYAVAYGTGTVTFNASDAVFELTENEFYLGYPNNDINNQPILGRNELPRQSSWTVEYDSTSTTDSNGCIKLVDPAHSGTFAIDACTNGEGLLVREYASKSGEEAYLSFSVGSLLP